MNPFDENNDMNPFDEYNDMNPFDFTDMEYEVNDDELEFSIRRVIPQPPPRPSFILPNHIVVNPETTQQHTIEEVHALIENVLQDQDATVQFDSFDFEWSRRRGGDEARVRVFDAYTPETEFKYIIEVQRYSGTNEEYYRIFHKLQDTFSQLG
uniref:Uncharacterized protein n=1 Tax=viral metagenome TaxID=1070528 RepID=A0A6C0DWX8_9ZZZZ